MIKDFLLTIYFDNFIIKPYFYGFNYLYLKIQEQNYKYTKHVIY